MFKRLAMLALLTALVASAKTYTFTISDRETAGNAQLAPGEYNLTLNGTQVVLTDKNGNRIDAIAKVEISDDKFAETMVITTKADGTKRIVSIQLGRSRNRVVFQ